MSISKTDKETFRLHLRRGMKAIELAKILTRKEFWRDLPSTQEEILGLSLMADYSEVLALKPDEIRTVKALVGALQIAQKPFDAFEINLDIKQEQFIETKADLVSLMSIAQIVHDMREAGFDSAI